MAGTGSESNRVVITGYGGICSLGENIKEIWGAVLEKKIGYDFWDSPGKGIVARVFGRIKKPFKYE